MAAAPSIWKKLWSSLGGKYSIDLAGCLGVMQPKLKPSMVNQNRNHWLLNETEIIDYQPKLICMHME
jgi:hypothetical protein